MLALAVLKSRSLKRIDLAIFIISFCVAGHILKSVEAYDIDFISSCVLSWVS